MNTIKKQMIEINQLCNESDEIYHNIARSYGLTDSIYWILYILYNYDEPVSQVDLCNNWSYSKQTVNTSIAALLKKEWITLEVIPNTRNRKRIVLTETGKQFCEKAIGETQEIERTAFSRISEEERELFITCGGKAVKNTLIRKKMINDEFGNMKICKTLTDKKTPITRTKQKGIRSNMASLNIVLKSLSL